MGIKTLDQSEIVSDHGGGMLHGDVRGRRRRRRGGEDKRGGYYSSTAPSSNEKGTFSSLLSTIRRQKFLESVGRSEDGPIRLRNGE